MSSKEYGYQGIEPGDLVVHGMDGFAGSIGVSDSRGKATPVLNVLDSTHNKRFLMYYLRNMAYGDVFLALSTGIRVRSCDLSWKKLGELKLILPPIEEQDKIVKFIDDKISRVEDLIGDKFLQTLHLKEYKSSLIYEYVTGKKQVAL
jgi:type I restriction enzyme S subunit